ncbi:zona pellucida sperm-binding protein 3-like [Polyodon spathula]|uniref:zona pellucida sperm-binding protein 3-like n=1 Tax=Polyodon spathula TaxID=7913 RepID=UPI001B7F21FF|nr:zona pellucida sperm-binding protein 3-like [Polyodon spathula]
MHVCVAVLLSISWAALCSSYRSHFEDTKEIFHKQRQKAAVLHEKLPTNYLQKGPSRDTSVYRSVGRAVSPLATVTVRCGQANMRLNVSADLFSNGRRVSGTDLRLGRDPAASGACRPALNIVASAYYVIDTALHACGSSLLMTSDKLVYTNVLVYTPPANDVIVRTNGAVIPIECHYPRKHNVSSQALKPTWIPFSSTKSAGDVLEFSLRLMSDDWVTPRISNVFYLNDPVRIEGSVNTQNHLPMRLFIDRCVATLGPEQDSGPRYAIIDYNGCLVDGSSPDSSAVFRSPRIQPNKLQFSVPAFRFHREANNLIYLTCHLKVTAVEGTPDSANKACFFNKVVNSWSAVEGSPGVCACCQTGTCPSSRARARRDLQPVLELTGADASLGPLVIRDSFPGEGTPGLGNPVFRVEEKGAGGGFGSVLGLVIGG